jgi:hypothetical protein
LIYLKKDNHAKFSFIYNFYKSFNKFSITLEDPDVDEDLPNLFFLYNQNNINSNKFLFFNQHRHLSSSFNDSFYVSDKLEANYSRYEFFFVPLISSILYKFTEKLKISECYYLTLFNYYTLSSIKTLLILLEKIFNQFQKLITEDNVSFL